MTAPGARTAAKRRPVVSQGLKCLFALSGPLIASGCAPRPVATIYCVSPTQLQKLKDAEPPKVGDKLTGQAQTDLKIIAENTVLLREYGEGLLGVLSGCQGQ